MDRVTPEIMTDLDKDMVFVFGSNESGIHGAGAAHFAYEQCGARLNQGYGLMAQCFGIPTKDWEIEKLPLEAVKFYIERFIAFTRCQMSSKWKFYVTRIGCGLAGFTPKEIAPLFAEVRFQKNIWLPQDFIDIIDGKVDEVATDKTEELYERSTGD